MNTELHVAIVVIICSCLLVFFYLLVLAGFVAGVLTQGKEGGELVYEYGINVQSDTVFDLKEQVKECKKGASTEAVSAPVVKEVVAPTPVVEEIIATPEAESSETQDNNVSSVATPE